MLRDISDSRGSPTISATTRSVLPGITFTSKGPTSRTIRFCSTSILSQTKRIRAGQLGALPHQHEKSTPRAA